jgi:adenylate kinase
MVKNRLSQQDAQTSGWLLDGYPRSAEQAEAIKEAGITPDVFILIDVSDSSWNSITLCCSMTETCTDT